jgi:hypothetical protein
MNTLRRASVLGLLVVLLAPALALAQTASPASATPAATSAPATSVPPKDASPEEGDDWQAPPEPAPAPTPVEPLPEQEPSESDDGDSPGPLVVGLELGAIFPQPFSELGTHVSFGLELGYALPFLVQKLEVMLAAAYAPPANDFELTDYKGEVSVQELTFSLGPRYRFLARNEPWNIAAALGLRLFLVRSTSSGSRAGESFAEFEEQSTEVGFFLALGGEYRLGPGALFVDLDLGYSGLSHDITGDGKPSGAPDAASTGNLAATLGYRLFLL